MTPRSTWATWVLLAALALVYVTGEVLLAAAAGAAGESPAVSVAFITMALVYLAVGGTVVTRLPVNPVGWLFCSAALFLGLTSISYGYAALTLDPLTGDGPPLAVLAAWTTSWSWTPPLLGVPVLLFLLFPDGRPPGPRWWWVVVPAAAGLGCVLAGTALAEGGLADSPVPRVPNPVGVLAPDTADTISLVGFVLSLVALVLAGSSLVLRLRRSRGTERQQLKWLMWSAGLLPVYLAVGLVRLVTGAGSGGDLAEVSLAVCLTVVPLAVGAAILRYRLYDIDVVIHRTLVYGALTLTLALAYLASVLVLRLALAPVTGGSDLAVAASTLVVAALFRPLRTRIQSTVDRRFYRARYDATRTLDAFASHLRDELDLHAVEHELRRVVLGTVHPTHVSLWLREGTR
jgi:hypothetical protein